MEFLTHCIVWETERIRLKYVYFQIVKLVNCQNYFKFSGLTGTAIYSHIYLVAKFNQGTEVCGNFCGCLPPQACVGVQRKVQVGVCH